ncbi:hypothetical protein [Ralstonia solanacearum]|uniref:hypothetical protein n=1 Tax=Ralstonia solanacearum TaxID=305 RepID=UPI001E2B5981|nr:hypothetical protein [Ralstonia solanacearum]
MKNIPALSKQITKLQTELERADAAKARCLAATQAAEVRATELRNLREQRTRIVAQAFADGGKPDTAAVDAEIAAYAEAHGQELKDGEAASSALGLLETRYTEYRDALAAARAELTEAALVELTTRRAKALEAFNTAIDATRSPLAELCALDEMERRLRGLMPASLIDLVIEKGLGVFGARGLAIPEWVGQLRSNESYQTLADELRSLGLEV